MKTLRIKVHGSLWNPQSKGWNVFPDRSTSRASKASGTTTHICYVCRQKGHFANQCPCIKDEYVIVPSVPTIESKEPKKESIFFKLLHVVVKTFLEEPKKDRCFRCGKKGH